jgi:hypothetical protein
MNSTGNGRVRRLIALFALAFPFALTLPPASGTFTVDQHVTRTRPQ